MEKIDAHKKRMWIVRAGEGHPGLTAQVEKMIESRGDVFVQLDEIVGWVKPTFTGQPDEIFLTGQIRPPTWMKDLARDEKAELRYGSIFQAFIYLTQVGEMLAPFGELVIQRKSLS